MKVAAYIGLCLIWGTTWLAIRVGMHGVGPMTSAGARFLIAGASLYALAASRGSLRSWRTLPVRDILVLAVFAFILDYGLIYLAEATMDSGLVAVLFSAAPFFTLFFARIVLREKPHPTAMAGLMLAAVGLCIVAISHDVYVAPLPAIGVIAAASCSAFANVYSKRAKVDALSCLPPAMTMAGAVMLCIGLLCEPLNLSAALSFGSVVSLLYLAFAGSATAFFLLLWLIDRLPSVVIGLIAIPIRIIALIVGVVFGGEHVDLYICFGTILTTIGLAIVLLPWNRLAASLPDIERRIKCGIYQSNKRLVKTIMRATE